LSFFHCFFLTWYYIVWTVKQDLTRVITLLDFEDFLLIIATTAWLSTLKIICLFFKCIPQMCTQMKPHHRIRVSQEMREDLKVWLSFLSDYSGITVMLDNVWTSKLWRLKIWFNPPFSQFSGCWLILSVYIIMSFDFPFVRLFGVR
jgi:hypothetical protein